MRDAPDRGMHRGHWYPFYTPNPILDAISMDCIKKKVNEEIEAGWIGPNLSCDYHPCHFEGQDCTFCYCPFYPCNDTDLGCDIEGRHGSKIWCCTDCLFIHRQDVARFIMSEIRRLGITEAKDPRFEDIKAEAKRRFYKKGRAVMVVGATSDAGKSISVIALCRILQRRGYLVAPFKSQNMSLNSKVTRQGSEIAMIQTVQAQACKLVNPDHHMNPILLKPKKDDVSQVMVCGKPYADLNVPAYYDEFVPGPGREIVKEHVDFLKGRYDVVVMEGAGSPAEINIYDKDIANMQAAVIADADVILVVNVEWGGSFAYALGTVELIPEEDRRRIKGIILNNVRGEICNIEPGARKLEEIVGIPVIGIIPHVHVPLPSEDSEALSGVREKGTGSITVGIIKCPRISNFTDFDPLFLEDVRIVYREEPGDMEGVDAVIIPGTKNTVSDLLWMRSKGIADELTRLKGKVPILGICGGYQMMGARIEDPEGIEGDGPGTYEGLGFFDDVTVFSEYDKVITNKESELILGEGGPVRVYELHMGQTTGSEEPMFRYQGMFDRQPTMEGSCRTDDMTFGTYYHGVFDTPAFRRHFLSLARRDGPLPESEGPDDYRDLIEDSIDRLADVFEENLDMDAVIGIVEGSQ